jgi:hypothetical protein
MPEPWSARHTIEGEVMLLYVLSGLFACAVAFVAVALMRALGKWEASREALYAGKSRARFARSPSPRGPNRAHRPPARSGSRGTIRKPWGW